MTYLRRRIEHLLDLISEGRLHFASTFPGDIAQEIVRELQAIRRSDDGRIDLRSVGPSARAYARMLYGLKDLAIDSTGDAEPEDRSPTKPPDLGLSQQELFGLFDEFFRSATGRDPEEFDSSEEFGAFIRSDAGRVAKLAEGAISDFSSKLDSYYREHLVDAYDGRRLPGMKLVVGGGRFSAASVDAVRSTLLYADTIFVPDPVLPWFEKPRTEERFSLVIPLEATWQLLNLRPLVDARLPYPAVVVFPSWEIHLSREDPATQDGIGRLYLDFMSFYLERSLEDESEVFEYAAADESRFLEIVERERLFWPLGGTGRERLKDAIGVQRQHARRWLSSDIRAKVDKEGDGVLVARTIFDRLAAQYHLRDNATSLVAHPLLPLEVNWHYYELCAQMCERGMLAGSHVSKRTLAIVRAINSEGFEWLGNVPIQSLAELRERGENELFRRRLEACTQSLTDAALEDLDTVVAEVGRALDSLLRDHRKDLLRIQEEYRERHLPTAVAAWATLAATFVPWLAPWVPVALPVGLAAKYAWDKSLDRRDRRQASQSLMGVLASTARRPQ